MNGAFYIGAVGLDAQQRALDVVANNISNINTTAFKRSAARFSELIAISGDATSDPTVAQPATSQAGVQMDESPKIWAQGDLHRTDNALDLAVDGGGLVEVLGPAGRTLLWRGGTLKINADGFLATSDGMPLKAMISVPADAERLTITPDGTVSAMASDGREAQVIGQIDMVTVSDADGIAGRGNGYYEAMDNSVLHAVTAGDEGSGLFVQGALEGSNVSLSDEMVTLLLLQRAFGANAQVVQAGDQLMSIVNGLRR